MSENEESRASSSTLSPTLVRRDRAETLRALDPNARPDASSDNSSQQNSQYDSRSVDVEADERSSLDEDLPAEGPQFSYDDLQHYCASMRVSEILDHMDDAVLDSAPSTSAAKDLWTSFVALRARLPPGSPSDAFAALRTQRERLVAALLLALLPRHVLTRPPEVLYGTLDAHNEMTMLVQRWESEVAKLRKGLTSKRDGIAEEQRKSAEKLEALATEDETLAEKLTADEGVLGAALLARLRDID
jgi:hypothetical protein